MGVVRNIVLHLLCAGMLVAAVTTKDPFFQEFEFAVSAGAFALAWIPLD
jgi:hypothetical protein